MRVILAAALALVATGAAAQTTVCGPEFGKWVCRTQAPPPNIYGQGMAAFDRGIEQGRQQRAAQAARDAEAQSLAQAANVNAVRDQVTAYVRDGKCDAAKALALDAGDMALADQAMRVCTPR